MKKVAVLYIATGKYVRLWPGFLESAEKYLLKSCKVEYFVFTDVDHLAEEKDNPRIHRIFQEPMLGRTRHCCGLKFFLKAEEQLKAFDYIYFFNANCEFKQPITEEMLLPRPEKHEHMVFVLHPAFYWRYNYEFTYDHNPRCKAYIPMGLGRDYVCGGINGGERDAYLKFCHTLQKRIRQDKDRGIIALWHDESHINWYAFTHPHYRLLDASFCFFPGWDTVKPCYIYIRPKEEYFDVDAFKRDPPKTQLSPKVEKYNEFMLKAARKIQRHMPWLPRRKRE